MPAFDSAATTLAETCHRPLATPLKPGNQVNITDLIFAPRASLGQSSVYIAGYTLATMTLDIRLNIRHARSLAHLIHGPLEERTRTTLSRTIATTMPTMTLSHAAHAYQPCLRERRLCAREMVLSGGRQRQHLFSGPRARRTRLTTRLRDGLSRH